MTARCGSFDSTHRAKTCRACQAIYRDRSRSGQPRFRNRMLSNGAACEFCHIVAGNSSDAAVYRYTIRRALSVDGKRTSRSIGSLGMCDPCAIARGIVKRELRREPQRPSRSDGLRSPDGTPVSLAS